VVQRVFALDADGEARGGGSAFGGVDHGVWMEAARSTINSGGRMNYDLSVLISGWVS
jgi:hypothetical protein